MLNFQSNPILADAIPAMSHNDLQMHSTYDLSVFKILDGNRNINLGNVERLIKSIEENGFLKMPIIVNQNYEVIDGQHRLEAAKKLNSIIYYLKVNNYDLNTAIVLNRNQSNWSIADYIRSYCDLGYKDYIQLQQFIEENKDFTITICAELTTVGDATYLYNKGILNSDFLRKGLYKFDINNKAEYIFNALRKIKAIIPESSTLSYCRAIRTCIKNNDFDLNIFVKKALNYPDQYRKSNTVSVIIANIEHIYNYRNQGKSRIILQKK
ncbi:MAG: hypothetical protein EBR82_81500 [Caulobacteraceae bacterium]|nr:hypothetical protein [Caulobacteraceae bacterium]